MSRPRTRPTPRKAAPIIMADGSIADLLAIRPADIRFAEIALSLSRIARWSGRHLPPAIPVGQHCVMGADAIFREHHRDDPALATTAAGYFLLHDAHEYLVGDMPRPVVAALDQALEPIAGAGAVSAAVDAIKAALDRVIHAAAGLPPLDDFADCRRIVVDMDERMAAAEARHLYGVDGDIPLIRCGLPSPLLSDSFDRPWPPMKTEEAYCERLKRYLGIDTRAA